MSHNMKILHLCNDFCGSKVHAHLYKSLDDLGVRQVVFTYVRDAGMNGRNAFAASDTEFVYSNVLRLYHRLLYHLKIRDVYRELRKRVDLPLIDCVHAVTLFSDGALAYRVKRDYGKPYVVSVRNTDVNTFLGYAPHTWHLGRKVLLNASRIVFISVALKNKFCEHVAIKGILSQVEDKFVVQPNGIDDYWIDHVQKEEKSGHDVLYVGRFDANKNVMRLAKAVLALRKQYPDVRLNLVGGKGNQEKAIRAIVKEYPQIMRWYGEVYDKDRLRKIYRGNAVFAMPSIFETFGLVYIEALTQNLRLLYTKGQGIDGLFQEKIGENVNPLSVRDIELKLSQLLSRPNVYSGNASVDFEMFRWRRIAENYRRIYEEVKGS